MNLNNNYLSIDIGSTFTNCVFIGNQLNFNSSRVDDDKTRINPQKISFCKRLTTVKDSHSGVIQGLNGLAQSLDIDVSYLLQQVNNIVLNSSLVEEGPTKTQKKRPPFFTTLAESLSTLGYKHKITSATQPKGSNGEADSNSVNNEFHRYGFLAAIVTAIAKGYSTILCLDIGGKNTDLSLIQLDSTQEKSSLKNVVAHSKVQTLSVPLGGHSIIKSNNEKSQLELSSGSHSTHPICYGLGEKIPTLTDALLLMGLLSPALTFGDGSFNLRLHGLAGTFQKLLTAPADREPQEIAKLCFNTAKAKLTDKMHELINSNQIDRNELTLIACGGNGPLFAAELAHSLGIKRIFIPNHSAAFSAIGAVIANQSNADYSSEYLSAERLGTKYSDTKFTDTKFIDTKQHASATQQRLVNFGNGYTEINIYKGAELHPGQAIQGPALIEGIYTSIAIPAAWHSVVDNTGSYELTPNE